ncbi:ACT domain-containing protein [Deinococcus saxicola]|uniref:ACT domain-containing protein n=1 Tax=Deinococcus saxicola TaxID=249406 RepID=UPI0039EF6E44
MSLTLSVLNGEYAVCQLPSGIPPPIWAFEGEFWSVTRAPGELSVVCAAANVPEGVKAQKGWAALRLHGPFEFTLTGILASLLNPLRDAGVGIFALSTFDTDYVLVPGARLGDAVSALRAVGHTVRD